MVKLYSILTEYKIYLKDLVQSKNSKIFMRDIFKLLYQDEIKIDDLINVDDKKQMNTLKKNFLEISKSKEEINFINKYSKGLINYLEFIKDNCNLICDILEKKANTKKTNEINYILDLPYPSKEDNLDKIYDILLMVLKRTQNKKYSILNYDKLFNQLVNLGANDSLDELCKLKKFIEPLQKYFAKDSIPNYYNIIHQKGINLIKNEQMSIEEILNFIYNQDIYYYDKKYQDHENRDPTIFIYTPITNEINIELLKQKKIWELFKNSDKNVLNIFYNVFLDQMLNIRDFINLLNLFPFSEINKDFIILINSKVSEIINTCFNEDGSINSNDKQLFELFQNILIINNNNKLNVIESIQLVQNSLPYNFTSNYFFFLLQSKSVQKILPKIEKYIINYFIEQHKLGNTTIDSLIFLLQVDPDDSFRIQL